MALCESAMNRTIVANKYVIVNSVCLLQTFASKVKLFPRVTVGIEERCHHVASLLLKQINKSLPITVFSGNWEENQESSTAQRKAKSRIDP